MSSEGSARDVLILSEIIGFFDYFFFNSRIEGVLPLFCPSKYDFYKFFKKFTVCFYSKVVKTNYEEDDTYWDSGEEGEKS